MDAKIFLAAVTVFALRAVTAASLEDGGNEPGAVDRNEMKKFLDTMEKVDIDHILNNTRLMRNNVKCFLNEGPCTAQLNEMKKMVPLLIKESCSPCTKEQKMMVKKAIDKIKTLRPNEYEKLTKFFDPEGKYEKKFYDSLAETE